MPTRPLFQKSLSARPSQKTDESERLQRASDGVASACRVLRDVWFANIRIFPVPFAPAGIARIMVHRDCKRHWTRCINIPSIPIFLIGNCEGNIRDILWCSSLPAPLEECKSPQRMFQFATVRHFLCGAYLSARFKRGKLPFRIGDRSRPFRKENSADA